MAFGILKLFCSFADVGATIADTFGDQKLFSPNISHFETMHMNCAVIGHIQSIMHTHILYIFTFILLFILKQVLNKLLKLSLG